MAKADAMVNQTVEQAENPEWDEPANLLNDYNTKMAGLTAKQQALACDIAAKRYVATKDFTQSFWEILAKCGAVIVLPGLIVIGFFFGLHAGVIAGAEKTLLLFKGLGRV